MKAEIRIPFSQVPWHHDVRQIQFHIAESNYKHGDQLDFHIGDLALLRYAQPTLLDVAPEQTVVFADARRIPVRFQLAGIKPDETAPVACELRREGRVILRASARARPGPQQLVLEARDGRDAGRTRRP